MGLGARLYGGGLWGGRVLCERKGEDCPWGLAHILAPSSCFRCRRCLSEKARVALGIRLLPKKAEPDPIVFGADITHTKGTALFRVLVQTSLASLAHASGDRYYKRLGVSQKEPARHMPPIGWDLGPPRCVSPGHSAPALPQGACSPELVRAANLSCSRHEASQALHGGVQKHGHRSAVGLLRLEFP